MYYIYSCTSGAIITYARGLHYRVQNNTAPIFLIASTTQGKLQVDVNIIITNQNYVNALNRCDSYQIAMFACPISHKCIAVL